MKATRTGRRFARVIFGGGQPAEGVEREGGEEVVEKNTYDRASGAFGNKPKCTEYYIPIKSLILLLMTPRCQEMLNSIVICIFA